LDRCLLPVLSTSVLAHAILSAGNASSAICAFWNLTHGLVPNSDDSFFMEKTSPDYLRGSFWSSRGLSSSLLDCHFMLPHVIAIVENVGFLEAETRPISQSYFSHYLPQHICYRKNKIPFFHT
jgi:hypothetical protein